MGSIKQGILGPFSGKVGTVIGSIRNGKGYMRGLSTSHKDAKTKRQLAQREKFKLTMQLVAPASDFIKIGYRNEANNQFAVNAAMSYNWKTTIVGAYPSLGIDPSKLSLSHGKLAVAEGCQATVSNNTVSFTWDDNSAEEDASISDFAMLAVYNFTKHKVAESLEDASRMDGKASVKIPASWKNDKLSCYISFASVKNNAVSDTIYIGDVKSDGSVEEGINGIILPNGSSTDKSDNEPTVPSGGGSSSSSGSSTGDGGGSSTGDNSGSSSSGGQGDDDHKELD